MMTSFLARLLKYVKKDIIAQGFHLNRLPSSRTMPARGAIACYLMPNGACATPGTAKARSNVSPRYPIIQITNDSGLAAYASSKHFRILGRLGINRTRTIHPQRLASSPQEHGQKHATLRMLRLGLQVRVGI